MVCGQNTPDFPILLRGNARDCLVVFLEILVFSGQITHTFDLGKAGSYNTFCVINVCIA